MKKTEIKKRRVIEESAKLFYFNGYVNTGLKEILEVCNIPKGSFYYYFKNKDDLLIHVIDYHTNNIIRFFDRTVNDLSIPKFKVFFHNFFSNVELNSYYGGSPLGNIANELSDVNEDIRQHLLLSYRKIEMKFSFFLSMLKNINPNYKTLQAEEVARVLVSQMEGTMLKIKLEKKESPIVDFFFIFDKLLKVSAG
jgi:TetR/AcrR family transcriptional repressor of nem operon